MLHRLIRLSLLVTMVWGADVSVAAAASKGRHLPDLRRQPVGQAWAQRRAIQIPLTVHVATGADGALIRGRRLLRWVKRTNEALGPYGIEVSLAAVVAMPRGYTRVTRWRERRGLAAHAPRDGTIHVFVVEEVDVGHRRASGGKVVRGMHWRYRGVRRELKGREYVVVADHAPSTTMAHEVGHLFGLRHHQGDDNLMCSCREGPDQAFTSFQGSNMRAGANRFLFRQRRR